MTLVLLICVAVVVAVAAIAALWTTHRHRQLAAWDRELDAAFVAGERRPEVPRHRSL